MNETAVERVPDAEFLAGLFDGLTSEAIEMTPSEWAEQFRYLPSASSPIPGPYRYAVAPYLKEIVDCFAVDSPIREVAVMKGVQLGLTTGVLENILGYCIAHVRTAPVMLLTADAELAKLRMEAYVMPMIQLSGLAHLIKPAAENPRKTGQTDKKIEWSGGGFCLPFGAVNANKLRSIPIRFLLRDEPDSYAPVVGKDGDPMALSFDRTAAYEDLRKVLDISTPTIKGQSNIEKRFRRGDQRRYYVRCLKCNEPQTLRWRRENPETGEVTGITWKLNSDGQVAPGSVRYLCRYCAHPHTNEDKTRLLDPARGAEWKPTAVSPAGSSVRSYHLSALYSPPGMQSWEACVAKFLEAWDVVAGKVKDFAAYQVFQNNVLGETFELRGDRVRFEKVSAHRRHDYKLGEVPNKWAATHCGSPVLVLTAAVDVHKDNLAVSVFNGADRRAILIDYWRFLGDTEQLDSPDTWGRLRKLIEEKEYAADDGKKYRLALTLVDSGYRADDVYRFADEYSGGVAPVKGRDTPTNASTRVEFSEFKTPSGTTAYIVNVDFYKDRWSSALKRAWDGTGLQPTGHFNAPIDATDEQLKELTVEQKRERLEKGTNKRIGWTWHRPSGAANELWDVLVYNSAALDMIAWDLWVKQLENEDVNLQAFFRHIEIEKLFFTD